MQDLVSRTEFSKRLGISYSYASLLCKGSLNKALHNKLVDMNHELVKKFIEDRNGKVIPKHTSKNLEEEIPDRFEKFADMTLRQLINRFGTDTAFLEFLKALKTIEEIEEKRLRNSEKSSELVNRELIKKVVINVIETTFTKILTDGSTSIAAEAENMAKAGLSFQEIRTMVNKKLSSFIVSAKNKIKRGLKNA